MSRKAWGRRVGLAVLVAVVAYLPAAASAQMLARGYLKNGLRVRGVFRDVVADTVPATVRVMADGEKAALGAVVSADGYILTKASQLAGPVTVRLHDGRELEARLVGVQMDNDLAMLKIEATGLPVIRWSDAAAPAVGQWLATPGLGDLPLSVGIVSTKPRTIPAERGILGIGLNDGENGPEISQVFPHSGADDAGLRAGDIILSVAGQAVANSRTLAESIQRRSPGESLRLVVRRGEKELTIDALLGDEFSSLVSRGAMQNRMGGELSRRRVGFTSALQHDQVLLPEDCGGPVVDLSGRVIGLNIARAGRTETFALPATVVQPLIADLKAGKYPPPAHGGPTPPAVAEVKAEDAGAK